MTEQQYNFLAPHMDVIKRFKLVGQEVSTAPREPMRQVYMEIYKQLLPLSCSSCIRHLYERINEHIEEYERQNQMAKDCD
jgi:hypothetical protein